MPYKIVTNNEGTHVVLDGVEISIKPDIVSALDFVAGHAEKRAEAAEARAAMLQECLGPNARILNQRRDEQIKQLTAERDELRTKLNEAMAIARGFVVERDNERKEREELYPVIDGKNRVIKSLRDDDIKMQRINGELLAERDTAWSELREIREAINADENEATSDEVRRAVRQRDELRAKLEQVKRQLREACNEVTDDVTRLQWLKSLIHEARCHINVLGDGDTDAVLTCLREAEDLHDALRAMLDGGAV